MKALTLKQPWADLVIFGDKRVENRSWPTQFRGEVLIHAGFGVDASGAIYADRLPMPIEDNRIGMAGHIIGVATITDCLKREQALAAGLSYVGHEKYCWIIGDSRPVSPIPCRGFLGLWDVDFSDMLEYNQIG